MAIVVFVVFVALVLAVSFYTSRRARSVGGYFVANSSVHWGVNGIAFAGGYLSVASFLGICGLIAFYGYDGFLYSIGFLAGWIVALFVIAEPMKRRGTFTFPDALNSTFKRPGIQLAAGLSVLVVSLFYLIPQMVGAGVLVEPLLGIPHHWGVIIVGSVVILIVAGGGMTSTTYVQLFNGALLLIFATVLTVAVLLRGVNTSGQVTEEGIEGLESYQHVETAVDVSGDELRVELPGARVVERHATIGRYTAAEELVFYRVSRLVPATTDDSGGLTADIKGRTPDFEAHQGKSAGWEVEQIEGNHYIRIEDWWRLTSDDTDQPALVEVQSRTTLPDGHILVNGAPEGPENRLRQMGGVSDIPESYGESTGAVGPLELLSVFADRSTMVQRL
jgi:cation/acetate symporter